MVEKTQPYLKIHFNPPPPKIFHKRLLLALSVKLDALGDNFSWDTVDDLTTGQWKGTGMLEMKPNFSEKIFDLDNKTMMKSLR